MKKLKSFLPLIAILFLAAFLRLWRLGLVPAGITGDEMGYIYNAYSLAKTGKNIFGEPWPFLTWIYGEGFPFLPTTTYLMALFFKIFGLSITTSRLPSALLGILDVFLLFNLVKLCFKDKRLALISALFLAISPWHLFLSRTAYDPNVAFFFFLLGINIFIREIRKKKAPILTFVAFWLALFSYRGMNPLFPALMVILFWYGQKVLKMNRGQTKIFLIGALLVTGSFLLVAQKYQARGYLAEALINLDELQEEVDLQIRAARGPLWLRRSFLNKPAVVLRKWQENYLEGYSIGHLFLRGEFGNIVFVSTQGKFYFLDFFLIILGGLYLFKKNKKSALLVLSLGLIAGLPGMVGGPIYLGRNFFLAAIMPIFAATGCWFIFESVSSFKLKVFLATAFILAYSYFLGNFLFDYYHRFAFHYAENWFKSLKDASLLIEAKRGEYDEVIFSPRFWPDLLQYAFYTGVEPQLVQEVWKKRGEKDFKIKNVRFSNECPEPKNEDPRLAFESEGEKVMVVLFGESCFKEATPSARFKNFDGNTRWRVYE